MAITPDNEDIELNNLDQLRFRGRESDSGGKKGYRIIRQGFNWNSIPSDYDRSVFEIRYVHDLGGSTVILPNDTTLRFNGGILSNGTIAGNNITIEAENDLIFNTSVSLTATFTNEFLIPQWFGAKGDGVNIDSNAIKKITDAAYNCFLPGGTYLVNEQINVRDNAILRGSSKGTTLLKMNVDNIRIVSMASRSNSLIEGISFEAKGNDSNTVMSNLIEMCIYAEGTTNVTIKDCHFENTVLGIIGGSSKNLRVTDCSFYNIVGKPGVSEGYGILINGLSENAIVTNNQFDTIQRHCIYLSGRAMRCIVSNNTCYNCFGSAIAVNGGLSFNSANSIRGCVISNNSIEKVGNNGANIAHGISVVGRIYQLMIHGNNIRDTGRSGISVNASDGLASSCIISNNSLYDVGKESGKYGVLFTGIRNTLSNNIIYTINTNLSDGIFIRTAIDCFLQGNQIYVDSSVQSIDANSTSVTGLTIDGDIIQEGSAPNIAGSNNPKGYFYRFDGRVNI